MGGGRGDCCGSGKIFDVPNIYLKKRQLQHVFQRKMRGEHCQEQSEMHKSGWLGCIYKNILET